ncbi:MAG: DUF2167 domain-containing protein [Bacteroidota bacterium]|nr:DUF2167 domain-containing protein [Bacteroidota bacterium]
MKNKLFSLILSFGFTFTAFAEEPDSTSLESDSASVAIAQAIMAMDSIVKGFDYQTGSIIISENLATVTVPKGFGFLNGKDAQYVLSDIWGNPADPEVLGMLVPMNVDLLMAESWAVIYSYEEDGHVKDDDAEDIDYDEMLTDMQQQIIDNNPTRAAEGFEPITLIGWAKTPYYDPASHKLHWAKELKFGEDSINTLNYNIRMLGRKGVLVMNIVSGMDNMKVVDANISSILASTNFNTGNTYSEFNEDLDKVAEYGIGGLIAGGILMKTGLLAKIGIFLVKGWKLIAIALVGGFALIRKKIFRKKDDGADQDKMIS